MIICPSCNSEIEDGAYTCPVCGAGIGSELCTITILKKKQNIPWTLPTTYTVTGEGYDESIALPGKEGAVFTVPAGVYTIGARYATKKVEITLTVSSNVTVELCLKFSGKLSLEPINY